VKYTVGDPLRKTEPGTRCSCDTATEPWAASTDEGQDPRGGNNIQKGNTRGPVLSSSYDRDGSASVLFYEKQT
jgi:hypothetical protein